MNLVFRLSYLVLVNGWCNETNKSVENLLDKYSAVVIVSGDGLLFEVIQGLFQRQAQCDIYSQNSIISKLYFWELWLNLQFFGTILNWKKHSI